MGERSTGLLKLFQHVGLLGHRILNVILSQAPLTLLENLRGLAIATVCMLSLASSGITIPGQHDMEGILPVHWRLGHQKTVGCLLQQEG